MIKANAWGLALLAAAALSACGGGGGSDTPATPTSITIAGTADKGAALAGAAVSVRCAVGDKTETSGADGKYSATITGASLPCVLKATGTEGTVLHSVVAGTGNTGTHPANITPLTELVVAKVAAVAPATFYASFGSSTTVTAASVTTAVDYVKAALAGATDLTVNPLTEPLVAGKPLDQIDAVVASLATAHVTLAEVTAAVVANPASPTVISAPLAAVASSCAWLKSGNYRLINPFETDLNSRSEVLAIDAVALTFRGQDGTTGTFTSDGACQFTIDTATETHKVMVSSAGVLVMYSQSKTSAQRWASIGLPEQTLPVSEFAGTWNLANWIASETTPGSIAAALEVVIDSTGQVTAASACLGLATCTPESGPFHKATANASSGGFDMIRNGASEGRAFVYKNLAGKTVFVVVFNDGELVVGTRKESLGDLPAVGTVSNNRQFRLNGNGTLSTLDEDSNTVTAIDATARTITRLASDSRVDTLTFDKPRDGLRYRALNSCTTNGVASNCREIVQLPLRGMGITLTMSVNLDPATTFFQVSIGKPD